MVDSGSTDSTLDLCGRHQVEVLYAAPGNMYRAVNVGLENASSPWVGYLNSDDSVYLNSYSRLISYGEKIAADIVYGACDFIDTENRFIHSYLPAYPKELLAHFYMGHLGFAQPAAIFRGDIFQNLNGFKEQYSLTADLDFFLRAALEKFKFGYLIGPPVACFRVSSGQLSQNHSEMDGQIKLIQRNIDNRNLRNQLHIAKGRLRNIGQYTVRILRRYQLSKKIKFVRTLDAYDYKDRNK